MSKVSEKTDPKLVTRLQNAANTWGAQSVAETAIQLYLSSVPSPDQSQECKRALVTYVWESDLLGAYTDIHQEREALAKKVEEEIRLNAETKQALINYDAALTEAYRLLRSIEVAREDLDLVDESVSHSEIIRELHRREKKAQSARMDETDKQRRILDASQKNFDNLNQMRTVVSEIISSLNNVLNTSTEVNMLTEGAPVAGGSVDAAPYPT